jgi:1,2-diacylglycerol 3-beta-glucosyltransferase
MILLIIEIMLLGIAGFFLGYLCILSTLALFTRKLEIRQIPRTRRFAVVIPAHNEETVIEKTVESVRSVDYPPERYDIIVIADNCADRTADIARDHDATVYERAHQTQRGKGYALRWCFDILLSQKPGYDAYVVVDADTVVSKNFLAVMDEYLGKGSKAIQSSDMVTPNADAWNSEVTRLGFTLYNYVRPLGRKLVHCPAGIRGNGMCFSSEVLRGIPWNTYSLNEDLEYGLHLLLNDITVDFAPEAIVWATMPSQARHAESQRARWEGGRYPIIRSYGFTLLAGSLKRMSFRYFDTFVDLITPPFVNLFGFAVLLVLCNLFFVWLGVASAGSYLVVSLLVVLCGLLHVVLGLFAARADAGLYKAFLYLPRYVLWKLYLYSKLLKRGWSREWIRTTRDEAVPHPESE